MSDIFREVDEALQQEKLENIWKEYRTTIIAAIAILLISTAATNAYKNWDAKRDAAETARLMEAMESDNPEKEIQNVINDTRRGHEALGLLSAAGLLLNEGKSEEAATLYKKVAEDNGAPRDFRDLARILYNQNAAQTDLALLQPLLTNDKSPWIWHARLQAAVIAGEDKANIAQALAYLKEFQTTTAIPLSLKQRADALTHVYALSTKETQ